MKQGQKLWTREELILAMNLYSKLEFGKMHSRNPKIIELASLLNRSPGSIAFKLVNFASMDVDLKKRGIKGADHRSRLDKIIWDDFSENWDFAFEQSEKMLAKLKKITIEELQKIDIPEIYLKGLEKKRIVTTRVNQYRFRQMVLANYNNTCCITGLQQPELLIASHITSWSKFEHNRLNPANGLCLNALHDKAFDLGLITVSAEDYKIHISSILKKGDNKSTKANFLQFEGQKIMLPKKFIPSSEFLKIHNDHFQL
ncbi:MAG: HNH endonuclease [Sediminibacterium sp.]